MATVAAAPRVFGAPFKNTAKKGGSKAKAWACLADDTSDDSDESSGADDSSSSEADTDSSSSSDSTSHSDVGGYEPGEEAADEADAEGALSDGSSGASVAALEGLVLVDGDPSAALSDAASSSGAAPPVAVAAPETSSDETTSSSSSSSESGETASDAGAEGGGGLEGADAGDAGPRGTIHVNEYCKMDYVSLGSRRDFIAHCRAPGHKCVLTRTANPSTSTAKAAQGRALGFLAAWCEAAAAHAFPNKGDHMKHRPDQATRHAARRRFYTLEGADFFVDKERPTRPGETSEPEHVP